MSPFLNEPYTDFSLPANRQRMQEALARAKAKLGRHYPLLISGERVETADKLTSVNPARPGEVVGVQDRKSVV